MRDRLRTRDVWLIDNSPATYVDRSDGIGKSRVTARHTGESGLIGTVGAGNMTTRGAGLRGIGRINTDHGQSLALCFVGNKGAQLVEGPAMQSGSLRLASLYPRADACQFFQGNSAPGAFSLFHYAFADAVIHVGGETALFAGQFLQPVLGRLGSFLLHLLAQAAVTMANVVDVPAGVNRAIRIGGYVDHAKVDPEKFVNIGRIGSFDFTGTEQVEFTANQTEIAFTPMPLQQFKLARAANKRHLLSTVQSPDAYPLRIELPGKEAAIIGNRPIWAKGSLTLPVELVGIGDLGNAANSHLCSKVKLIASVSVNEVMQGELSKDLRVPGHITDVVASLIRPLKRSCEQCVLFLRRLQFDLCCKFHCMEIIPHMRQEVKRKEEGSFLPAPRDGVSAAKHS